MTIGLTELNMTLDILLKLILLVILLGVIVVLKHLDESVKQAGRSADSVQELADKIHKVTSARTLLSGLKKLHKAKKGKKIDVE